MITVAHSCLTYPGRVAGNPGLADDVQSLANAMAHLPALTSLSVARTALIRSPAAPPPSTGVHAFFSLFFARTHLQGVYCVCRPIDCGLDDACMVQLAEGLRVATRLRVLDLGIEVRLSQRIASDGATAFALALSHLRCLESLNCASMCALAPPPGALGRCALV